MNKLLGPDWKADLSAGFTLFLIALPLSVGIALASGAPASAGIVAAILGGMLGSLIGGSQVTINGPAAGLIVVILGAVEAFGHGNAALGFQMTLVAICLAGLLEIIFGALKLGSLALSFPNSVIHGMLAAIGIIIMIKQLPVALGSSASGHGIIPMLLQVPHYIANMNPSLAIITISGLFVMIVHPYIPFKFVKRIPAPLMVVGLGIAWASIFELGPNFLLHIPSDFSKAIITPDFSQWNSLLTLKWGFTIAIIAALESTLSVYAIDKIDPQKRTSNLNKDLMSKGVVTFFLGLIGGIPIIAEIVRSSANIEEGAKTFRSNFLHGMFVLTFVALFPSLLQKIPLASLASILMVVCFRLAHPKHFKHAFHIGFDNALPFLTTLLMTLFTDLLIGIACGVIMEVGVKLFMKVGPMQFFKQDLQTHNSNDEVTLVIKGPCLFSHYLKIKNTVQVHSQNNQSIVLDLSISPFVDYTFLEQIERLKEDLAAQGTTLKLVFSQDHTPISHHEYASRRLAG